MQYQVSFASCMGDERVILMTLNSVLYLLK
jgi:hypothetical protein